MTKIIERNIFMGSNTADGFVGYYNQIVDNYPIDKLYILKGGSGVGKSTFIRKFAGAIIDAAKQDQTPLTVDYLICSADPSSVDGAIIHEHGIAILDGTYPHITDPKYPGLVEEIIDLAQFIDPTKIKISKDELQTMMAQRKDCFMRAYKELHTARELHHKVESIMTPSVDFKKVDEVLAGIIGKHV